MYNLFNGFWPSYIPSRLPLVPPQVDDVLQHESNSAGRLLLLDDPLDAREVRVERVETLKLKSCILY